MGLSRRQVWVVTITTQQSLLGRKCRASAVTINMEAARNEPLPFLKIATLLQEDLVVVPLTTRSVPSNKMVIASLYNSDIKHSFTMAG